MREQLLGYLLGALDADEQAEVERQLAADPELRCELELLREQLLPLESGRIEYEPPGDLVSRTCTLVETNGDERLESKVTPARLGTESLAHRSSTRMFEMLITAGVCAAMALLFFPAVLESRDQARRTFCRDSLRELGVALTRYSMDHDTTPSIPAEGPFSFAGIVPVKLREYGFLVDTSILVCPGSDMAAETFKFSVPSIDDLRRASGRDLLELKRIAGGAFGYNLGVFENGRYSAPVYEHRENFVWAGDAPSFHLPYRISANHGGRGMNLLFEDGHTRFVSGYYIPGTQDDVLRSWDGLAEAGRSKHDSVIGQSLARPRISATLWGE